MDTDNTEDGIEYLEEPMISLTKLIAQYGMDEVTEAMSMVDHALCAGAGDTSWPPQAGARNMSADELRMEQIKVLFAYGDDDAQEIARAELISGMLPLEEAIPYLDLASCVRPSQHVRRTVGIARRARVHRTR